MSTDVSVRRGRIELQQAKNQSRRPQPYQKPAHTTQTLSDLEETQLRCTYCRLCMCLACSGSWCQPAFTPGHWPDEAQHSTTAECRVQTLTLVFILAEPYLPPAFVSQVVLANSADFQVEGQASLPQSHSRDLMLSESWLFQYPCDHVVLEFKPSLSPLPLCHGDTAWGRDQGSLWGSKAKEETI